MPSSAVKNFANPWEYQTSIRDSDVEGNFSRNLVSTMPS